MTNFLDEFLTYQKIYTLSELLSQRKLQQNSDMSKNQVKTQAHYDLAKSGVSRSKKKIGEVDYQISFESNILDCHVQNFFGILQCYCKIADENSARSKLQVLQNNQIVPEKFDYIKWISQELTKIQTLNSNQLISDWHKQLNLIRFLKIISCKLDPKLTSELIFLTSQIWQKYLQCYSKDLNEEQRVRNVANLVSLESGNLYSCKQLELMTSKSCQCEQMRQEFKKFVTKYSEIVYLVVQGYFFNPFQSVQKEQENNCDGRDFQIFSECYEEEFFSMDSRKKMPRNQ